ncbi:hypothetical protein BB560_005067 [Smittium megazygosporum]|uniref:Proteasome maturation factor UMP1 n=1 Tax=Smittium megazygosporum TaxID=133381 RepID=A0A2T9Z7M8_9FUNG|nr:hypothetical protein BB560_005067 [Smittium megazygosporum]
MTESNTLNDYKVHDTLRFGPKRIDQTLDQASEFEAHLKNVAVADLERKLSIQKTSFGGHMPFRTLMELSSVARPPRPEFVLPSSNLHLEILSGQDETIDVHDIFNAVDVP